MIVEYLESFYDSQNKKDQPPNPFRASRAGHCIRAMAYDVLGVKGEPLTPRRSAVFRHGHIIDSVLKQDLKQAMGDKFLNLDKIGRDSCVIEGVKITYEPDGAFQTDDGNIGIVEIKTMSDYGFNRALKGEIDRIYLCQAWVYHFGTSFNPVVFLCYRKETSHFVEVVFDRNATEIIVTQRFGGDPIQLATEDPLMIAQVRSPFDASVEQEVREKFKRLAEVKTLSDLPQGVNAIEDEVVKVQGKAAALDYMDRRKDAGLKIEDVQRSGSWYAFLTGRKIAGFPCSYCSKIKICLGAKLEIKDGKPTWVMAMS